MESKPPYSQLMLYRIGRGEERVFSSEPPNVYYKSLLLPHWRFRTVSIAQESAQILWRKFEEFGRDDDFVGMDLCRKYVQMGMTRAKRYANYKGGRKYVHGSGKHGTRGDGVKKMKGEKHEGKDEKEEASLVFRAVWERCKAHEGYVKLKNKFLDAQNAWKQMSDMEKTNIETEMRLEMEAEA